MKKLTPLFLLLALVRPEPFAGDGSSSLRPRGATGGWRGGPGGRRLHLGRASPSAFGASN